MKPVFFSRSGSRWLGSFALASIMLGWAAVPGRAEVAVEPVSVEPLPEVSPLADELAGDLTGEIEAQLEDIGGAIEKEIRDRIDPEAIERAARPIVRQSLRTVLDVAPEMSRRAIIVGEWYLGQWGDRALEELENAVEKLEDFEDRL